MASPFIELQNVSVNFGEEWVLKDVDLTVDEAEICVLIGPSGQGKSTVLKLIAGLITPQNGTVCIQGQNLYEISQKERAELLQGLGMLFQKNALFDSLTSGDNIRFPLVEKTKLSEGEIDARIETFLEAVAIPHARDLFPDEISGGMQKRLGIARALALDPKIVLYDDPTAGLDPITSRRIVQLILDLQKKENSTVVAITNDMNRAYQMADKIAMVVDQTIVVTGDKSETQSHADPRVQQFIHGELSGPLTGAS